MGFTEGTPPSATGGGGLGDSGSARQDKEAGTHRAEDAVRGAAQSGFEENCQL